MKKLLTLFSLIILTGCATFSDQRQFDPGKAMQAACAIAPAAKSVHRAVCSVLEGEAKKKCEKNQRKANAAMDAILSIGAGILGACQIGG